MQLGRGLKDIPAFHLIEVLEEAFEGFTNF